MDSGKAFRIGIIGGGASGLCCAVKLKTLAPEADICIMEKLPIVGKKILATGNGRCNLSNFVINDTFYNGDKAVINTVIDNFSSIDCMRFFGDLGLKMRDEENRLYPYSMSAESVRTILENEVKRLGVKVKTDCKVESLEFDGSEFIINQSMHFDICVLAIGGKAAPMHGTDGDGYRLLKKLGIRYEPIYPALVQIKTSESYNKDLKGVRVKGVLFLREENDDDTKPIMYQEGEIQFTDYGISGIPAMQLSGKVAQMTARGEKPNLSICFTPDLGLSDLNAYLDKQVERYGDNLGPEILYGLLNEKVARVIYDISSGDTNRIALNVMALPFTAVGTNSYRDAQVTGGGVGAAELRDKSLETSKIENLYICGELLNVDGTCGGYNLHFAWGSGIKVAEEIAQKMGVDIEKEAADCYE